MSKVHRPGFYQKSLFGSLQCNLICIEFWWPFYPERRPAERVSAICKRKVAVQRFGHGLPALAIGSGQSIDLRIIVAAVDEMSHGSLNKRRRMP